MLRSRVEPLVMRTRTRFLLVLLAVLLGTTSPALAKTAKTGRTAAWAPAATAAVHPGVQTHSPSGQCTANFIFTNGTSVLIGQAAHCTGNGAATSTDGCAQEAPPLPLGTKVTVDGASKPGTLVYSSWNAMISAKEKNANTCAYNDFALVRLDPADAAKVNPSIPFWGGPSGVGTAASLDNVYTYGNSSLRLGVTALSPKVGTVPEQLFDTGGWSTTVYTASPGIPGDSGSAFLNASGKAMGILVTVDLLPYPGSNGVTDLGKAMAYARSHGLGGLQLANGTESFSGV
jgi:hypothetical protein